MKEGTGNNLDYRKVLESELQARCAFNPLYSLRAFARDLRLGPSHLSGVLNRKKGLSLKSAQNIGQALGLKGDHWELFMTSVQREHARNQAHQKEAAKRLAKFKKKDSVHLDLKTYESLKHWYYDAIIELFRIEGQDLEVAQIAKKLGLSHKEVDIALQRLLEQKILIKQSGKVKPNGKFLATPSDIPSRALKTHHHEILNKGHEVLEKLDVESRDFSTIMMAIDPALLPEAKEELRKFRRKFCRNLESKGQAKEVFCLAIQFYPVTKNELVKNKEKKK